MKQRIYLRGELLGAVEREPFAWIADQGGWPVVSTLHVCPICQSNWALLAFEKEETWLSSEGVFQSIRVEESICDVCGGGSLLTNHSTCNGTDWGLLEALPKEYLRRELLIHIQQELRKCASTSMPKKSLIEWNSSESEPPTASSLASESTSNCP